MDKRFFLKRKSEKKHVFQFQQSNCHRSDKETLLRASVHSACLSTLFSKELQGVTGVMFILRPDLRWADLKATVDLRAKYICFINLWCWLSVLIYLECRSGWWSAGGQWHRDLRSAHVTLKQHQLFIGAERIKWHPGLKTENSSLSDPVMWWWRCAEYESINLIFTVRADISPIQNIHMTWSMSAGHRSGRFFFFTNL